MSILKNIRWKIIGTFGRAILWLWAKSTRMTILGEEDYLKLRSEQKPVVLLVWHSRILIVPFFFRRRGIMPLISPSKDGEIAASIMSGWGYKILRGSGSHPIIKIWNEMKKELKRGGELLIVPDGPRGPNRKMKAGGIKLAHETGAYLVLFSFSTSKKKYLNSWDNFLMFYPFSKGIAIYGKPIRLDSNMETDELEKERQRIEHLLVELDNKADHYYN